MRRLEAGCVISTDAETFRSSNAKTHVIFAVPRIPLRQSTPSPVFFLECQDFYARARVWLELPAKLSQFSEAQLAGYMIV
jgi:hypothetical protein